MATARLISHAVELTSSRPLDRSRILVVVTTPLGDTLFAGPAIQALRNHYPNAHMTALGLPSNAAILGRYPEFDEVIVWRCRSRWSTPVDLFRLAMALRQQEFDVCVEMTPIGALFTHLAGIPERVGFGFRDLWWLLPNRAPDWRKRHAVSHYGELVKPLGAKLTQTRPRLSLTESDRASADTFLREHDVCLEDVLVTVHPGASTKLKRWDALRFASLADRLEQNHGVRVVVVGGKQDYHVVRRMLEAMTATPVVAAGRLGVLETAAVLERAALHVGNDSGPLHLAVAVGTPTVGLFGPTNQSNFRPVGPGDIVMHKPRACSPCTHFVGGSPVLAKPLCRTCACLDELGVDEVEAACARRLAAIRRSASRRILH